MSQAAGRMPSVCDGMDSTAFGAGSDALMDIKDIDARDLR
jgi:hypothetical protein